MNRLTRITAGALTAATLLATGGAAALTASPAAAVSPATSQTSTIQPAVTSVGAPNPIYPKVYRVWPHGGSISFPGTTPVTAKITSGTLTGGNDTNTYVGNIYAKETVNGVTSDYRMVVDVTGISSNTMGIEFQLASNNKFITAGCGVLVGKDYRYAGTIDSSSGGPNVTINDLTLVMRPTA